MSQLTDWLNEELEIRGWSYNELARRANLSKGVISAVMTERQGPGTEFCNGIARAFGIPPEEAYRKAGLLQTLPEEDDVIRGISLRLRSLVSDRRGRSVIPYIAGIVDMFYKQILGNGSPQGILMDEKSTYDCKSEKQEGK